MNSESESKKARITESRSSRAIQSLRACVGGRCWIPRTYARSEQVCILEGHEALTLLFPFIHASGRESEPRDLGCYETLFPAPVGTGVRRLSSAALICCCAPTSRSIASILAAFLLPLCWALSASAAIPSAKHVLVIGCDGFGSLAFTSSNTPVLHKLMREGAWTLHARGVLPTVSSPNWASMIMGAGPAQHGVTSNEWETNKFDIAPIAVGSGGIFPTIFGVVREQRPNEKIAVVHDWDGFARLLEPKAPDLIENVKGSPATAKRAIQVIGEMKPDFMFIHFDDVDHAGHTYGWKSPEYFQAADAVDALIGDVLRALEKAGLDKDTLVIMTADHGGKGTHHGNPTMDELEIPWIVHGPGVAAGHEIKDSVNTYDLAPTIAWVLGLKAPSCWIGRPVLEAFDANATAKR